MGKNLKKVIFSVLLLAAVIIVSPKDAKAAGSPCRGYHKAVKESQSDFEYSETPVSEKAI